LVQPAQFFKRLTSVVVGVRIFRVGLQHHFEFDDGAIQVACFDPFHRQAVAGERVGGILRQELLQYFQPWVVQSASIQPCE